MFASIPHHVVLLDFSAMINVDESDTPSAEKITEIIYSSLNMCQRCAEVAVGEPFHADESCLTHCNKVTDTARGYFTFNPKRLINVFVKGN